MEITQQADYAIRTVLELALHADGECVVSNEIARRQGIPAPFLAKIVARLAAAGIVATQRGVSGGIRLARSASQITLLDAIEAIDGPITLNRCMRSPSDCSRSKTCVVHPVWLAICTDLRIRLNSFHFAMLAEDVKSKASTSSVPMTCLFGG